MSIRFHVDLAFDDTDQAQKLQDVLLPFLKRAVVINEGAVNEERGYIQIDDCGHDDRLVSKLIARWEVGRGKVS